MTDLGVHGPLGVVDVHYPATGGAHAALLRFADVGHARLIDERTRWLPGAAPYEPGAFATRELPAILAVVSGVGLGLLTVDGYVDLDPTGRPGLGARVHAELGVPVIGVAKSAFRTATHAVPVVRGQATKPLYVTAAGIDLDRAATLVRDMAGPHRVPDALRDVDRLARGTGLTTANPGPTTSDRVTAQFRH